MVEPAAQRLHRGEPVPRAVGLLPVLADGEIGGSAEGADVAAISLAGRQAHPSAVLRGGGGVHRTLADHAAARDYRWGLRSQPARACAHGCRACADDPQPSAEPHLAAGLIALV